MSLSPAQKKTFRRIGHHLNPVVQISENGLSEGARAELERALNDHELIKIKLAIVDRDVRGDIIEHLASTAHAEVVQIIGKTALLYRKNPRANPRLSNVVRYSSE